MSVWLSYHQSNLAYFVAIFLGYTRLRVMQIYSNYQSLLYKCLLIFLNNPGFLACEKSDETFPVRI
jgi:hypothetical protein